MKNFRSLALVATCAILAFACGCSLFRGSGRTKADTLLVTGNYRDSRLLCRFAQYYTKQPIILFSSDIDGSLQMFFIPTYQKAAEASPSESFTDLISLVNPKRVIFIGGDEYVPSKYVDEARKVAPTLVLDSTDWSANARELGRILKRGRLQRIYDDYRNRMDERGLGAN